MSNYATLKQAIQSVIKTNGNEEITGAVLQSALLSIIDSIGANYTFAGVATPQTDAGAPDQNLFYLGGEGTYTNFGSTYTVERGKIGIFSYNGSWTRTKIDVISGTIYNASEDGTTYSSLSAAISTIPTNYQVRGVIIKYMDNEGLWHTYYCAHTSYSTVTYRWREIDKLFMPDGTVNAPNIDFGQCYTTSDNKNTLYGNLAFVDKVNYIKLKIRNNGSYRFLGIYKVNVSNNTVTFIRSLDVLFNYKNGEIAEIPIPQINCAENEYIAVDGSIWYAGQDMSGTQNAMTRFSISKDGSNYATATGTPIGFVVGYKSKYETQIIKTSNWGDSSFSINNSSSYADLWANVYHVDNAVGIKLRVNLSTDLTKLSVYKFHYFGSEREKICDIDLTPYSDKAIIDVYFDETVYFSKDEYMGITSPFYYTNVNALIPYQRIRKYSDGSINLADNMFIGFMPITLSGIKKPSNLMPLIGKRISIIGDSISTFSGVGGVSNAYYPVGNVDVKEKMWFYQLESLSAAIVNRVNAIGGSRVTGSSTNQTPLCAPSRYEALYSDGSTGIAPDVVFILGGVNDWNGAYPIGDYTQDYTADYDTLTTFIPSYRKLISGIQQTYPKADVYCLTPLKSFYNASTLYPPTKNGLALTQYVDAIKECASLHGAKVIDLYNKISINEYNISTVLRDTLHPTLIGQSLIAGEILKSL